MIHGKIKIIMLVIWFNLLTFVENARENFLESNKLKHFLFYCS